MDQATSNPSGPWVLTVGQPFSPERLQWEADSFEYRYWTGNHLLQLCLPSPSHKDIDAFHRHDVRVALYVERGVLFWIFKIDALMDWSDQPLSIHLVPEKDRAIPDDVPGGRATLSLVLVDSETGIVSAMRAVTYSAHFTSLMLRAFRRQLSLPFDRERHRKIIADVYRKFPNSKAMARAALVMEKAGV